MKRTFTLAEMLIALVTVGIVFALTLPTLVNKINDDVRARKIENVNLKLKNATDKLMAMEGINGYSNTLEFVQALGRHMKIISYCQGADIYKCWPYSKINLPEQKSLAVNKIDQVGYFSLDSEKWSEPVAFVTGDGTSYIISYNRECSIDENDSQTDSTECIAGIYDWNGAGRPNKYGTLESEKMKPDVLALGNIGLVHRVCSLKLDDGICFMGQAFSANGSSNTACAELSAMGIVKNWNGGCYWQPDRWANAYLKCHEVEGKLPSKEQLKSLANYVQDVTSQDSNHVYGEIDFSIISTLGFPSSGEIDILSDYPSGGGNTHINMWKFYTNGCSEWSASGSGRNGGARWAICVGED